MKTSMEDGKHEKKSNQRMLSAALIAGTLAGCGSDNSHSTESTAVESTAGDSTESADSSDGETEGNSKYKDFITVDVFDSMANYQGIQSGWFAKIVKDKFNMELNIIAQNVAGGGDTLFQTRSAAGDLGDLIITGCGNGRLQNLVTAGLVIDMTDYLKDAENVHRYDSAIETTSQLVEEDGIWAIPSESSSNSPTTSSEGLEPNYGAYLRWDAYKAAGYPELNTLEDLLPALQKMQEAVPTSDSGKQTYAISLFKDWDGNLMSNAKPEASLYGYDEIGFVLAKADGSDYQSFIDSDSAYVRSLKFLFEANQMGLVDPESTTQNYDTLFAKYQDGQILFSPCERSVVLAENCGNSFIVSLLEIICDQDTCISLICFCNLAFIQITDTWNFSVNVICMGSSIARNCASCLCPACSPGRMGMYDSADFRECIVKHYMSRCIRRWIIFSFYFISL